MASQTNSAKLLFRILEAAWNEENNKSCRDVWKDTFLTFKPCEDKIVANFSHLSGLIHEVRSDISNLSFEDKKELEGSLFAIDSVVEFIYSNNLLSYEENSWVEIKQAINPAILYLINQAGGFLNTQGKGIKNITEEELNDIKEKVSKLIENISIFEIDISIKIQLLNELKEILDITKNYGIRGANALARTNNKATGFITKTLKEIKDKQFDNLSGGIINNTSKILKQAMIVTLIISSIVYEKDQFISPSLPKNSQETIKQLKEAISEEEEGIIDAILDSDHEESKTEEQENTDESEEF